MSVFRAIFSMFPGLYSFWPEKSKKKCLSHGKQQIDICTKKSMLLLNDYQYFSTMNDAFNQNVEVLLDIIVRTSGVRDTIVILYILHINNLL